MQKAISILAINVILILCISIGAKAGAFSYTCQVKEMYSLSDKGTLQESKVSAVNKNRRFSVSRDTGEIIGPVMETYNAYSTEVISKGSRENSFIAVANFKTTYQFIKVEEYKKSGLKPFVAFSASFGDIVTGLCK